MKISVLFAAFICLISLSCKKDNPKDNDVTDTEMNHSLPMENALMNSMETSNSAMLNYKTTGDFDVDFANIMLLHHQMAIDMSKILVKKGKDATIKNIANGIIAVQETEISEMRFFIQNNKPVKNSQPVLEIQTLDSEMKAMMDKMNAVPMTDNIDKDYVAMMIPHHESAVSMAKNQILFGKNDGLKALAKTIIKNQNIEIEAFKSWQKKK
jgi:uncharacterized protein (DUF305 family)